MSLILLLVFPYNHLAVYTVLSDLFSSYIFYFFQIFTMYLNNSYRLMYQKGIVDILISIEITTSKIILWRLL